MPDDANIGHPPDSDKHENVAAFPPRDPIFALAPELQLRVSETDGELVVNSREVARVFLRDDHRAGPMLHDEVWATIAAPEAFLCLACIEKRLGRGLTQDDLTSCPFNAGWIDFDGADVAAMQFARGRRLLPRSAAP